MFKFKTEKKVDFLINASETNKYLKNITQIAKKLDCSREHLSKIVNGTYTCSEKLAKMIVNLIEAQIEEYFDKE